MRGSFVRSYVAMVAAMLVGMVVLEPVRLRIGSARRHGPRGSRGARRPP